MNVRKPKLLAVALLLLGAAPASAAPGDRTLHLVSMPGSDPSFSARLMGASSDGTRLWFQTQEPTPALGDNDALIDVYERSSDGNLRLISVPDTSGLPVGHAFFTGATSDGSRVWFGGHDGNLYERRLDNSVTLVNAPTSTGNFFWGATSDGSRLWYQTRSNNPALGDTDGVVDLYERTAAGDVSLATPGTATDVEFAGHSADGTRLWFHTTDALDVADTDGVADVYERSSGVYRLISETTTGATATFAGASGDGSRVWYTTNEANTALGDTNAADDVYERFTTGAIRLVSAPGGGGADTFQGASADGSRVWFTTDEPNPALGDANVTTDLYERNQTGLRLISEPTSPTNLVSFAGANSDGSRVRYFSQGPVPAVGDTDTHFDGFERGLDGRIRLLTPGVTSADAFPSRPIGDGTRSWFTTLAPNPALGDTDSAHDIYELAPDGTVRLVTPGGATGTGAELRGSSADGTRVWYEIGDPDPAVGDNDTSVDVFELRWGATVNLTAPAISGAGSVGQTLGCTQGTWAGESLTFSTQWTRDGAPLAAVGGTYLLAAADAGHTIGCTVTATNATGSTSASAGQIAVAPHVVTRAGLRGISVVGTKLTCDTRGFVGQTSLSYRWRRGATFTAVRTATYTLSKLDLGRRVTCVASATNAAGTVTSTTVPRAIPKTCRVPKLRGVTPGRAFTIAGLAGCRVRVTRVAGTGVKKGTVLRSAPPAGTRLPNGTRVRLFVRR